MSRMLKELKSLTPFGWDKKLETHRPGPAMLRDWEKMDDLSKTVETPTTMGRTRRTDMMTPAGSRFRGRKRDKTTPDPSSSAGGPSAQSTQDGVGKPGDTPVGLPSPRALRASFATPASICGHAPRLKASSSAGRVSAQSTQQQQVGSARESPLVTATAPSGSASTAAAARLTATAAMSSRVAPASSCAGPSLHGVCARGAVDSCSSLFATTAALTDKSSLAWQPCAAPSIVSVVPSAPAAAEVLCSRDPPSDPAAPARDGSAMGEQRAGSDAMQLCSFGSNASTGLALLCDDKENAPGCSSNAIGTTTTTSPPLAERSCAEVNRPSPAPPQHLFSVPPSPASPWCQDACVRGDARCPSSDCAADMQPGLVSQQQQQPQAGCSLELEHAVTIGPEGIPEVLGRLAAVSASPAPPTSTGVANELAGSGCSSSPKLLSASQPPLTAACLTAAEVHTCASMAIACSVSADMSHPGAAAAAVSGPAAVHMVPQAASRQAEEQTLGTGAHHTASGGSVAACNTCLLSAVPDPARLQHDWNCSTPSCPDAAGEDVVLAGLNGAGTAGAAREPPAPWQLLSHAPIAAHSQPAPGYAYTSAFSTQPGGLNALSALTEIGSSGSSSVDAAAWAGHIQKLLSATVTQQAAAAQAGGMSFADVVKAVALYCRAKGMAPTAPNVQSVALLLQLQQRRSAAGRLDLPAAPGVALLAPVADCTPDQPAPASSQRLPAIMPLQLPPAVPIEATVNIPLHPAIVSVHHHLLRGLQALHMQQQQKAMAGPALSTLLAAPCLRPPLLAVHGSAMIRVSSTPAWDDTAQRAAVPDSPGAAKAPLVMGAWLLDTTCRGTAAAHHLGPVSSQPGMVLHELSSALAGMTGGAGQPAAQQSVYALAQGGASAGPVGASCGAVASGASLMDEGAVCVLRLGSKRDSAVEGLASKSKSRNWKKARCMI